MYFRTGGSTSFVSSKIVDQICFKSIFVGSAPLIILDSKSACLL